jgi:hypothetical protein
MIEVSAALSINLFAVANPDDKNDQFVVLNLADDPEIA